MAKIEFALSQINILAGRKTLVIQSEDRIEAGDALQLDSIEIEATEAKPLRDFGRFNWKIKFVGEDSELRERLTYHIGGQSKDPPRYGE